MTKNDIRCLNSDKPNEGEKTEVSGDGSDRSRDTEGVVTAVDMQWCREELHGLLERVYPPLVIRELLILQAGVPGKCCPCTKAQVYFC